MVAPNSQFLQSQFDLSTLGYCRLHCFPKYLPRLPPCKVSQSQWFLHLFSRPLKSQKKKEKKKLAGIYQKEKKLLPLRSSVQPTHMKDKPPCWKYVDSPVLFTLCCIYLSVIPHSSIKPEYPNRDKRANFPCFLLILSPAACNKVIWTSVDTNIFALALALELKSMCDSSLIYIVAGHSVKV